MSSPCSAPSPARRALTAVTMSIATMAAGLGLVAVSPSQPAAAANEVDKGAFIAKHAAWAQASEREYGVPASVTLAQAILESGWGRSGLTVNANNYFGIKCNPNNVSKYQDGCYSVKTKEWRNGKYEEVKADFRKYNSPGDSFADHGLFLTKWNYRAAFAYSDDADKFIDAVWKGGYATSPTYGPNVIRVMETYNLYQYNVTNKNWRPKAPWNPPTWAKTRQAQKARQWNRR